jgi:hypothetical protein
LGDAQTQVLTLTTNALNQFIMAGQQTAPAESTTLKFMMSAAVSGRSGPSCLVAVAVLRFRRPGGRRGAGRPG